MEIREDRWLSAIFGRGVFKIDIEPSVVPYEHPSANICDLIRCHASQQAAAMYYTRVDTNQVGVVRRLSSTGLYVVDVNVTFGIDTDSPVSPAGPMEASICEVSPKQHQGVLDIAATCFQYSRFHLDPFVPNAIANRVKHDWVLNYIRKGRGEQLFVALIDKQPVGFLAVLASELDGKRVKTIDLIGVNQAFQKRGIGQALAAFFIQQYKDQCDFLRVGTQVANVTSMRLYQKLGFLIIKSQYVMHMHVRGGISVIRPDGNREIQP